MSRVTSKFSKSGLCLTLLLCLSNSFAAEEKSSVISPQIELKEQQIVEAEKSALSLNEQEDAASETLYAGTSMWFLLSIALLGSITVKRRVDPDE